ncbi:metal-sensitive transcriptional regulator [Halobacteriovorax sp. XZX-3]|uniref:metal-sensitive transcriptional regulator n=1 Tax=unclassified Halobacteriovorax TaxID=2639665 RepID=UPI001304C103|nr:metal-sensitive transcriptional regulator [Halobacteriovorax sp. DA5]
MNEIELEKFINTPGADHRSHLNRLKRIQGQLESLINLVEDGKYCINIVHRSKTIRGALRGFESSVMENHLRGCVAKAIQSQDTKLIDEKIDQLCTIIRKD